MSVPKYTVFDNGGLLALVNQTKANKTTAAENTAAVDALTDDFQQMGTQIATVMGEVETCLNELDTTKADVNAVEAALKNKADVSQITALQNRIAELEAALAEVRGFASSEAEM